MRTRSNRAVRARTDRPRLLALAVGLAPRGTLGNGLLEARTLALIVVVTATATLTALPALLRTAFRLRTRWQDALYTNRDYVRYSLPYTVLGMVVADSLPVMARFLNRCDAKVLSSRPPA